jgi:AraC-like DNA-binding protein
MDALSDVLRAVRLSGAVFFDVSASPPWVAEAPSGDRIVGKIFPGADHLMSYHVVTQGSCWGGLVNQPPVQLLPGDIIVFPHGDPHVMSSKPGMRGAPDVNLYQPPSEGHLPFTMTMGAPRSEAAAHVVCGFLGCDTRPFNPLLSALPRVIHQRARAEGPLAQFVQLAVSESRHPRVGGEVVLGRLSELLFVDVVRHHLETLPEDRTDWLAGLRDRHVGRALTALHTDPARDWTIEMLAREAGLSRSAFAERFTTYAGQPPMQYLASWRMQTAAHLLLSGVENVAEVGAKVGYESEAAFSRAFKKIVGVPPGEWRRHRHGAREASAVSAEAIAADRNAEPI